MPVSDELVRRVDELRGIRALVVGDAMLDQYIVGSVDRVSVEAPVPVLRVREEFDRVGGAASVAATLRALGGEVHLVGLRGASDDDGWGGRLAGRCAAHGIETTLLPFLPRTVRKARMMAARHQLLRVDWEEPFGFDSDDAGRRLSDRQIEERRGLLAGLLAACDVVLVSDYAKGMVDPPLMEQLRASGLPVVVDPRPQHAELYAGVRLMTPNRGEAMAMLGVRGRRVPPPEELAGELCRKLGAGQFVTLGEDGIQYAGLDGTAGHAPARAREVFDVTGAGDAVAAVAALGIAAGMDLGSIAHLANAAGGVVVRHVGTAIVSAEELRRAVREDETGDSS